MGLSLPAAPDGPPTPDLIGLCQAYAAGAASLADVTASLSDTRGGYEDLYADFADALSRQDVELLQHCQPEQEAVAEAFEQCQAVLAEIEARLEGSPEALLEAATELEAVRAGLEESFLHFRNAVAMSMGPTSDADGNLMIRTSTLFLQGQDVQGMLEVQLAAELARTNSLLQVGQNSEAGAALSRYIMVLEAARDALRAGESRGLEEALYRLPTAAEEMYAGASALYDAMSQALVWRTLDQPTASPPTNYLLSLAEGFQQGLVPPELVAEGARALASELAALRQQLSGLETQESPSDLIQEEAGRVDACLAGALEALEYMEQAPGASEVANAAQVLRENIEALHASKMALEQLSQTEGRTPCVRCGAFNQGGRAACEQCGAVLPVSAGTTLGGSAEA